MIVWGVRVQLEWAAAKQQSHGEERAFSLPQRRNSGDRESREGEMERNKDKERGKAGVERGGEGVFTNNAHTGENLKNRQVHHGEETHNQRQPGENDFTRKGEYEDTNKYQGQSQKSSDMS